MLEKVTDMLLNVINRSEGNTPKAIEDKSGEANSFTQMVEKSYEEDQEKM